MKLSLTLQQFLAAATFGVVLIVVWPLFDGSNSQGLGAAISALFLSTFVIGLTRPILNRLTMPPPIVDPDLGTFAFDDAEWQTTWSLNGNNVDVRVDGDRSGMDEFARSYFHNFRSHLPRLWSVAVEFAQVSLQEWGSPWSAAESDFRLQTISFHRKQSFDGGHLVFWFDIRPDQDGSYYVSFRDERPFYLHRDS